MMRKLPKFRKRISKSLDMRHFWSCLILASGLFASCGQNEKEQEMLLWYSQPASHWMTSALPVGNGELGALFFGGIDEERIQFNEKTLWTGSPTQRGAYQSFGDIFLSFKGIDSCAVSSYKRSLSLNEAVGRVQFTQDGTSFHREYFASNPDSVVVVRIYSSGKKKGLDFTVSFKDGRSGTSTVIEDGTLLIQSQLELLSYEAQLKVINEGGSLESVPEGIEVKNAKAVTLLLSAATNFSIASENYIGETKEELHERVSGRIGRSAEKGYKALLKRHLEDYRPLYSRVSLDLQEEMPEIPTDELVKNRRESRYLDMLYFQYGRYLMLASSRGMSLPNNLQGIWNADNTPPWECDIHSNINIQMNYWPAESTNLSECHLPFLEYVAAEAVGKPEGSWRKLAAQEGHRGWTVRTQNNIFGYTDWNINRPANAWYSMHLWQHFIYTMDYSYLKETAFPVMKSACEYWLDRLEEDEDGKLIAPDEWSPEQGPWEDGLAYAQQLIWQLFDETVKAFLALEEAGEEVDDDFFSELVNKFLNLDNGLEIGSWGQIKEWKQDSGNLDFKGNQHRHLSHLIALYPGNQISYHKDSEYADAAKESLLSRGDMGTGWSRAWKIACWARLFDGDHAYKLLKTALNPSYLTVISMRNDDGGVFENLFDSHPPFQIDGNFGATAGIAEMLLQSHQGYIHLLPALPSAWPSGSVEGLRAEEDFTLDISWSEGELTECCILSGSGMECKIYFPDSEDLAIKDSRGKEVAFENDINMVRFPTVKGESYRLCL